MSNNSKYYNSKKHWSGILDMPIVIGLYLIIILGMLNLREKGIKRNALHKYVDTTYNLKMVGSMLEDALAVNYDQPHNIDQLRSILRNSLHLDDSDFNDFLNDPFLDSAQVRVTASTGITKVYSVGPDGEDGLGDIAYDPTNGIISSGDIVICVMD